MVTLARAIGLVRWKALIGLASGASASSPAAPRPERSSAVGDRARRVVDLAEGRMVGEQLGAQLRRACRTAASRPRRSESARRIAQSSLRLALGEDRALAALHPALGVDVEAGLLGVGGARQDDVGAVRAAIAVGAEVDDEGVGRREVDLVGAQQEEHVERALLHHLARALAAVAGNEAEVEAADAGGGRVQHVPAVPAVAHDAERFGDAASGGAACAGSVERAPAPPRSPAARPPCSALTKSDFAVGEPAQRRGAVAQVLVAIGQVRRLADQAEAGLAAEPHLAEAGVQHRRLEPRIGPDQQHRVGGLDAGEVELNSQLSRGPAPSATPSWRQSRLVTPSAAEEVERRLHRFGVLQVAGDHADAVRRGAGQLGGHDVERLGPGRRLAACRRARIIGRSSRWRDRPSTGVAGLVGDPLLVDLVVGARQHPQHRRPARIDADRASPARPSHRRSRSSSAPRSRALKA